MISCKKCLFNSENLPTIELNDAGICNMCLINEARINSLHDKKKVQVLENIIKNIKKNRKGKYDCLIGISGGTDSSYLVFLAKKWGLNPLLLHVDGGWNSATSVINIERIVEKSGFDFITEVLPWKELQDVQRAFLLSNVLDIDLPFDNLIMSYNYRVAAKYQLNVIINGYSTETEGIMPPNFAHYKYDKKNILAIQKKYGLIKLKQLKFLGTFEYLWFDRIKKIKFMPLLDYIEYNKAEARKMIQSEFDWRDYGGKHYENIFTRFYQGYILPKKFKVDKRISHISMLICCKQITRPQAIEMLEKQGHYTSQLMERDDRVFFTKKLNFSQKEFENYMLTPEVSHRKFESDLDMYDFFKPIYKIVKKIFFIKTFKI